MISVERASQAREMAAEAAWLATCAFNEERRNSYLELQRQWNMLTNEIENANGSPLPKGGIDEGNKKKMPYGLNRRLRCRASRIAPDAPSIQRE